MGIYLRNEGQSPSFTECFCYTWSDQHYTIPKTWSYSIEAKGAWSNTAAWGLARGTFNFSCWDELSIMVGRAWNCMTTSWCCAYGFGWSSNRACKAWGGLSWVFTWCNAITACSSSRALVIWGGAWGWVSACSPWWAWGGLCWKDGCNCCLWTLWSWWTQTWHGTSWNKGANQFNWWNWGGTYWYWWGGWRWGWNASIWDGSCDDDKGAWGWSGYVRDTARDVTLTQWGWCAKCCNGGVVITFLWYYGTEIKNVYLWCNS